MTPSYFLRNSLILPLLFAGALSGCGAMNGEFKLASSELTNVPGISVRATNPNGAYRAGQTITLEVSFPSKVVVTGTPTLKLATGRSGAEATYISGNGTTKLVFTYTIQAGDGIPRLDYSGPLAISEATGTIKAQTEETLDLTLSTPGRAGSIAHANNIILDTDLPTAVSNLNDGFGIASTTSSPITTWTHATDAASLIATYQVAIGTTLGGTEVLNWTSQTAMNAATVTGLSLSAGTTYYTSVRAVDAAGNVGTETTGDGWRAVNTLTISPATKMLVTNERYPFAAAEGYPGYTYSIFSGAGNLTGNLFTAPANSASTVLRATDLMNSTASAAITTRQFGKISSLAPQMTDAQLLVGGIQYDSLGNLYVAGSYTSYKEHWLVKKFDGSTWTTLLDEVAGDGGRIYGIIVNSPSDIWVVGDQFDNKFIWKVKRYDGTTWTESDSFSLSANNSTARAIAKGPGGEIYVVGEAYVAPFESRWIVRKYASGVWTTFDNYQRNGVSKVNVAFGAAVNSIGEVFVVGTGMPLATGATDWVVRKYSGGMWTNSEIVGSASGGAARSIAIDSADNVYVAGFLGGAAHEIRKFSGGVWSSLGSYGTSAMSEDVGALTLDNTGRPYVIMRIHDGVTGKFGQVTRYSGSGTTWELVHSASKFNISAITKNSAGEIVFAGDRRSVAYPTYSGNEWVIKKTDGTTVTSLSTTKQQFIAEEHFTDIAFDSHGNAYVSGYYSKVPNNPQTGWIVKKFDGTTWTLLDEYDPDPTVSVNAAHSVFVDENDHVWVSGSASQPGQGWAWTVRKYDGTSWTTSDIFPSPTGGLSIAQGITAKDGKVYAVGSVEDVDNGWTSMAIRRFDGTSWSTVYSDDGYQTFGSFHDVIVDSNNVVWAVLTRLDVNWGESEIQVLKSTNGTTWTVSETNTDPLNVTEARLVEGAPGEIYVTFENEIPNGDTVGTIRKWNGTTWSTFDQTTNGSAYYSGARDSEGNLYFVGYEGTRMMIKKWNGYYLDKVYSPSILPANSREFFEAVSVGPNGKLIGVGTNRVISRSSEPFAVQLEP